MRERRQTKKGDIESALRRLERRMGCPRWTLDMEKMPGRGGWRIRNIRDRTLPFGEETREARDMLSTFEFASEALAIRKA
jgi:hypothetical protein